MQAGVAMMEGICEGRRGWEGEEAKWIGNKAREQSKRKVKEKR